MNENLNKNIFRDYTLDYIGRYNFYEEDELVKTRADGKYILDNLKKSNRFDYDGASYTFTKFDNISEGRTKRNVILSIYKENINVKIDGENTHLDLIYKMDIKKLEDHYRITTRISEKGGSVSVLLYVNNEDAKDCIEALKEVKKYQETIACGNIND